MLLSGGTQARTSLSRTSSSTSQATGSLRQGLLLIQAAACRR
jgi:hypothetical protein